LEIVMLHYEPMPISLSDNAMDQIMVLTAPLVPTDRVAFMHSLAALLKSNPAQPVMAWCIGMQGRCYRVAHIGVGTSSRPASRPRGTTSNPGCATARRSGIREASDGSPERRDTVIGIMDDESDPGKDVSERWIGALIAFVIVIWVVYMVACELGIPD
jgi:hypothetical protein